MPTPKRILFVLSLLLCLLADACSSGNTSDASPVNPVQATPAEQLPAGQIETVASTFNYTDCDSNDGIGEITVLI
jgi:hypothetical protein